MKTAWKIAATLFLLILTLTCCGFVRNDMSTTVNKDGSVDVSITYLVDDASANKDDDDKTPLTDVRKDSPRWKALEENGYTLSEVTDNGYTGLKATCHYDSLDAISRDAELGQGTGVVIEQLFEGSNSHFSKDQPMFTVKKGLFKDTYSTHMCYDADKEIQEAGAITFDYKISVLTKDSEILIPALNNSPIEEEKTSTGKNSAPWSFSFDSNHPLASIDYSFSVYNRNFYLAIYGGIGLLVLIGAGVAALLIWKRKKKSRASETNDLPAPQSPEEAAALLAFISGETNVPPPPTETPVTQPKPQAPVAQPRPQAPVAQPKPQAPVVQPKPQAPVTQPRPQAPVAQPKPQAPVAQPKPQTPVTQPRPQAPVAQPKPQAPVTQPRPQAGGPTCPHCGGKLNVRVTGAGDVVMVCENYPTTCKFTMSI